MATKKKSPEQPLHPEMPPSDEGLARHAALGEPLRRCTGSARFGIESHEAPIADFPKQPSQPDGFGRMCLLHWREYTAGLRKDALARKAGDAPAKAATKPKATGRRAPKPATKAKPRKERTPSEKSDETARAEALIAEVDALPADEHVKRVGDADVQAALEVSAASRMLAD